MIGALAFLVVGAVLVSLGAVLLRGRELRTGWRDVVGVVLLVAGAVVTVVVIRSLVRG